MCSRSNGAWFPMALSCGSLPALTETFPLGLGFMRVFFLFLILSPGFTALQCKLGLSCRKGTLRGCVSDVSFLPNCLAFLEIFFCVTAAVKLSPSQPIRSSRAAGGETCRHIDLQTHRTTCKSHLALESMWKQSMIA